jgi:amino acid transporter
VKKAIRIPLIGISIFNGSARAVIAVKYVMSLMLYVASGGVCTIMNYLGSRWIKYSVAFIQMIELIQV